MSVLFRRKLPIPKEIKEQYPLKEKYHRCKAEKRAADESNPFRKR
ncbi:MAG: hypothetical protein V8Q42_02560 [Anaerovoracaceae bacterium]